MKIPHDPSNFEKHFKDDNEGPLSNEGYMPYLNRYILDKVRTKGLGLTQNTEMSKVLRKSEVYIMIYW